jgi:anaerobic ribonucleoside-triphosphate reductase
MGRHSLDGLPIVTGNDAVDVCNVCKKRPSTGFDDFFGYTCNLCDITHRLRYRQQGVNPWGGRL